MEYSEVEPSENEIVTKRCTELTESDVSAIRDFYASIGSMDNAAEIHELLFGEATDYPNKAFINLGEKHLSKSNNIFFYEMEGGKIKGIGVFKETTFGYTSVDDFSILTHPLYFRTGVARRVGEKMLSYLREKEIKEVRSYVYRKNEPSIAMHNAMENIDGITVKRFERTRRLISAEVPVYLYQIKIS